MDLLEICEREFGRPQAKWTAEHWRRAAMRGAQLVAGFSKICGELADQLEVRRSPHNVLGRLTAERGRKQGLAAGNARKQERRRAVRPGIIALAERHLQTGTAPHDVVAKVVRDMRRLFPEQARSKVVISRMLKPLLDPLREAQRETRRRK